MPVVPVPCFQDNYAYLVYRNGAREAAVIDPCDAAPVEAALARHGLELAALLCTHHHPDHVDGIEALVRSRSDVAVVAHRNDRERTPRVTRLVQHGDIVEAAGIPFRVLHVPGHTSGSVAWLAGDVAFTGDTLFLGGCGRVFEGTPEVMYHSLHDELAPLPPQTRIYCGHEYTESNLGFGAKVEPANTLLRDRLAQVRAQRARREPTVPGTLAEELQTNPFLRCTEPDVVEYARMQGAVAIDPASVFAMLRNRKNVFKG